MRAALDIFAVTAPGLEEVCAAELVQLGLADPRPIPGGVAFAGGLRELYLANLWLRSASRVLVRLGEVAARDFPELHRKAVRLPWGSFVRPGTPLEVRASSRSSRLNHTGRIAETLAEACAHALGTTVPPALAAGERQLMVARFEQDRCLLSLDSSGELLHRRGYRSAGGEAPMRETLAAGLLLLLGWDGREVLADPLCGSGTIAIEAALLGRRLAPGRLRQFAFMSWPGYRAGLWQVLLAEAARQGSEHAPLQIRASDHAAAAVSLTQENASRAGVAADLACRVAALSGLPPSPGPGLLLTNPPYGARLGAGSDPKDFYRTFGAECRRAFPGWRIAFLAPELQLARATGLPLRQVAALSNGGIPVGLYLAEP